MVYLTSRYVCLEIRSEEEMKKKLIASSSRHAVETSLPKGLDLEFPFRARATRDMPCINVCQMLVEGNGGVLGQSRAAHTEINEKKETVETLQNKTAKFRNAPK